MCLFFAATAGAQETDFRGWEDYPGLDFHLVQGDAAWQAGMLTVQHSPVRDHVSGSSALRLTFAASPLAGGVVVYRPAGAAIMDRTGYAGISIWIRGDGSEGVGVLGIGEGADADPRVTFRLKQRSWQPLRVRWEDFDRPGAAPRVPALFFGVTPGTKRPASYTIDRIELVRGVGPLRDDDVVRAAGEAAGRLPDAPRPEDLSVFATERAKLASVRALVGAGKPARVLVIGDAVARGSALWNVPPGARTRSLFPGALVAELKAKSPQAAVATAFVDGPEGAVAQVGPALRALKYDLVVLQLSCSPPGPQGFGAVTRSREAVKAVFAACRAARVEVIALAVPPLPDPYKRVDYAVILLEEAAEAGVPAIDFGRFAAARGGRFEGEYYATPDQLNVQGHLLAAKLIASSIVNP